MKDNKKNIFLLILGSLLTVVIAISLVVNNKNKKVNDDSKEDTTKPHIYEATYTNNVEAKTYETVDKETYKIEDIKVPYVNLKGEAAKTVNTKYKELYDLSINNFITGFSDNKTYVETNYESYTGDDLVSTVLIRNYNNGNRLVEEYYPYTINLETDTIMTYEEVLKYFNKTKEEVNSKIIEEIKSKYESFIPKEDYTNLIEQTKGEFNSSVTNDTVIYYVNKDGLLTVCYRFYVPASSEIAFEEVIIK